MTTRSMARWADLGGEGAVADIGRSVYEGNDPVEAQRVLDAWLACSAAEEGRYCYAHSPGAQS